MNNIAAVPLAASHRSCTSCALRQFCLPASLDEADLQRLEALVKRPRPITEGQFLYLAGSKPQSLYVVRRGSLISQCHQGDGEEQVVGLHLPGELVGLESVGLPRYTHSLRALEKVDLCSIDIEDFNAALTTLPALGAHVMRLSGQLLRQSQSHQILMSRRSALERVARFLAEHSRRLKRLGWVHSEFALSLSRKDLASYLGLQIETVSRSLSALRDSGVLHVSRKMISIQDPAALVAAASGSPGQLSKRVA